MDEYTLRRVLREELMSSEPPIPPPNSRETEEQVLACLLLGEPPEGSLRRSDFFYPEHRALFDALLALFRARLEPTKARLIALFDPKVPRRRAVEAVDWLFAVEGAAPVGSLSFRDSLARLRELSAARELLAELEARAAELRAGVPAAQVRQTALERLSAPSRR